MQTTELMGSDTQRVPRRFQRVGLWGRFFRWPVAPRNRDVKAGPMVRWVVISSAALGRKDGLEFETHLLVGHHG